MDVVVGVIDRFEQFFASMGLMSGVVSPVLRGLFAFGVASVIVKAAAPEFAFEADGSPRPWAYISSEGHPTLIPWWMPGLFFGIIFSLFI